jgi:hypothetical protein
MNQPSNDQYDASKMTDSKRRELEEYVLKGYNIIYNDREGAVKAIAKNPAMKVKTAGTALFLTGLALDQSREKEGRPPFGDDVKMIGGFHLMEKLVQFAGVKGVKFKPEEEKAALKDGYQQYMINGIKNRTIDPQVLAVEAERLEPGSVKKAMAEIPDTNASGVQASGGGMPPGGAPGPGGGMPPGQGGALGGFPGGGAPQGQPPGGPPAGPGGGTGGGLLSQPSPLEMGGLL